MIPEFMTPGQAMQLLRVRSPKTLRKLRQAHPDLAIRLPGMKHWRYVQSRVAALLKKERP